MELGLNGAQLKQFVEALESAFPFPSDLQQMVQFGLDESLYGIIAVSNNLRNDSFSLIRWAEARGRTPQRDPP